MAVDDELRWAMLERLASLGALDLSGIDAELARDRSTQGAVHAAKCRALLPEADAKAAAWQTLMTDTDALELRALRDRGGFLASRAERDHRRRSPRGTSTASPTPPSLRHGWIVARLALLAYPRTAVDGNTLALGEKLLAATISTPASAVRSSTPPTICAGPSPPANGSAHPMLDPHAT